MVGHTVKTDFVSRTQHAGGHSRKNAEGRTRADVVGNEQGNKPMHERMALVGLSPETARSGEPALGEITKGTQAQRSLE